MTRRWWYLNLGHGACEQREQHQGASTSTPPKLHPLKWKHRASASSSLPLPLLVNLIFPAIIRRKGRSVGAVRSTTRYRA